MNKFRIDANTQSRHFIWVIGPLPRRRDDQLQKRISETSQMLKRISETSQMLKNKEKQNLTMMTKRVS
jgi:hypothetical protein